MKVTKIAILGLIVLVLVLISGAVGHPGPFGHTHDPTWPLPGLGEIDDTTLDDMLCFEECEYYEIYEGPTPCDPPGCNAEDYMRIEEWCSMICE